MAKSKVKLTLIANKTSRKTTFKKRKGGIVKKLNELVTLCGVKACAVFYSSQNDANPEAWPSKEGAEKLYSRFMEFPEMERSKKMYDQKAYTWERYRKENAKLKRLQEENREFELREFMFDLFKGKMMMENHYYEESVINDLSLSIGQYVSELTRRIQILQASGESVSFPPLDAAVADAAHPVPVSDVSAVTTPTGLYDLIRDQYQNMNIIPNQQAPAAIYGWNQDMSLDLNHNLTQSSNQHPNQHQPFMNQWMAQPQQMRELASVASMNNNNYRYHQLPTASHMPSTTTTTTTGDLSAPNTNNKVWPTRIGFD